MPLQKRPIENKIGKCANPDCGKEFIRRKRDQQYCCLSCASRHNKFKRLGKRRKEYKAKFCEWCDKWFIPTTSGQKYCCPTCAKEAAKDLTSKRLYKKLHPERPDPEPDFVFTPEPPKLKPKYSMDEVLKYMYEHNCQYRKAVQALENDN